MSHPSGRMRGSVIPFGTVDADRFRALGIGGLGARGCQIPGIGHPVVLLGQREAPLQGESRSVPTPRGGADP